MDYELTMRKLLLATLLLLPSFAWADKDAPVQVAMMQMINNDVPAAGGCSTTNFVTDNFAGALNTALSAHTPDVGSTWVHEVGGGTADSLLDGTGNLNGSGSGQSVYANAATPPCADYGVQVTLVTSSKFSGVICRLQDASNYYGGFTNGFGSAYEIRKVVAGTQTTIATSSTWTLGSTETLKLNCVGTTISLVITGTDAQTLTATGQTNFTTAGLAGLGTWNSDAGMHSFSAHH